MNIQKTNIFLDRVDKMKKNQRIKKSVKMIDPPSGWKYGFPKPIPEDVKDELKWLVENGYPQEEIDSCGKHFWCRYWIGEE